MKMYQILGIKNFCDIIKKENMPIKTAYKFSKLLSRLNEEVRFYQERFYEILEKYGEKDQEGNFIFTDDGKNIKINSDKLTDCQNDINELNNLEIVVDNIKFTLDELSFLNLKIEEVDLFFPLIEE